MLSCVAAMGFLTSCSSNESGTLPIYPIERMVYEDVLAIDGHTESVNSININCPSEVDGTIISIVETGTLVKEVDVVCVIEDVNIADNYDRLVLNLESAQAELEKLKASQELEFALLEAQVRNNDTEAIANVYKTIADAVESINLSLVMSKTK